MYLSYQTRYLVSWGRWKLKAKIEKEVSLPLYHSYEVHLVNKEEARWYRKYVREKVRI